MIEIDLVAVNERVCDVYRATEAILIDVVSIDLYRLRYG